MRTALILLVTLLFTSCEKAFDPEPDADPRSVIRTLWEGFDEGYAVFGERGMDWDSAYTLHVLPMASSATEEDLYSAIIAMLEPLDDGHVQLVTRGRPVWLGDRVHRERPGYDLFQANVVRNGYLEWSGEHRSGTSVATYGKIAGEPLGYVHFNDISQTWDKLSDLIAEMGAIEGLVIDLRRNQGGDFTFALDALAQFNRSTRPVFTSRTRNGPMRDAFTTWHTWYLEARHTRSLRIVMLTDRYTISAAERAVLMLRAMDDVVHLGDTTNGALSTALWRELPNGWYYRISIQQVEDPDGARWEGIGIPPDQVVQNTSAGIAQGIDAQLEAAIEALQ
jgi:carboxyl-terminal processing protease